MPGADAVVLVVPLFVDDEARPDFGWPQMSRPWPFVVPFETEGNALWQELEVHVEG